MKCSDVAKLTGNTHPAAFPLSFVYLFAFFSILATSHFPFVSKKTNPKALGISLTHVSNPYVVEQWRVWRSFSSTSDESELSGRQRSRELSAFILRYLWTCIADHRSSKCRSAVWIDSPHWSSHYMSHAPAVMIPAIIREQLFHQKCIRCFSEWQTARSQRGFRPNFIS